MSTGGVAISRNFEHPWPATWRRCCDSSRPRIYQSAGRQIACEIHVPLLFQYRGEVIPVVCIAGSALWLRIPCQRVKIDIGSFHRIANGKKIPIRSNGTALINPVTTRRARHIGLNELLLAAQQQEKEVATTACRDEDQIIFGAPRPIRLGREMFSSPQPSQQLQTNSFIHRVSPIFDWIILLLALGLSGIVRRFSRLDLALVAFAFSAAYCLLAIAIVSRWFLWLPGVLPLGAVWLLAMLCLFSRAAKGGSDLPAVSPPPPSL